MEVFQQNLEALEEQQNVAGSTQTRHLISRVYQPDRISFSSYDALASTVPDVVVNTNYFYQFRVDLKTPAVDVKGIQLIRATIPNIQVNIPDDETVFWYYKASHDDVTNNVGTALTRLHMVRLLPSTLPQDQYYTSGGFNRYFNSYQDLVDELNKSCANDPIATDYPAQTIYIPNDIQFGYDASQNKIFFNGTDPYSDANPTGFHYWPAPFNDPKIKVRTNQINQNLQTFVYASLGYEVPDQTGIPFNQQRNLNLRLGYTTRGNIQGNINPPQNAWRPVYTNTVDVAYFDTENGVQYTNFSATGQSFPDLVYTANCHVYADVAGSSGFTSDSKYQLLATVPVNTPTLGVSQAIFPLNAPLTKTSSEIYSINFTLLTDTGEPFWLPNSAITNFEIRFTYD